MNRRAAMLAVCLLVISLTQAAPAWAGGGCHEGVTQGTGDTVEMLDACFTPTALRIEPGDAVTFVNRDPFEHNVSAYRWGNLEDMHQGDAFTATFTEDGIYPYACMYHPSMTGVVVVGDGRGPGNGETVAVSSFREPSPPSPEVRTVTVTERAGTSSPLVWLAAGIGLAAGLAVGSLGRRRRGTRTGVATG